MSARQPIINPDPCAKVSELGEAIKALSEINFQEGDFAHLITVLSSKVQASNWRHYDDVDALVGVLDGLHDDILYRGSHAATFTAIATYSKGQALAHNSEAA